MSNDIVKRARELLAAATPGPWEDVHYGGPHVAVYGRDGVIADLGTYSRTDFHDEPRGDIKLAYADAALIAAAPEIVAKLCDEVERLRKALKVARDDLEYRNKDVGYVVERIDEALKDKP